MSAHKSGNIKTSQLRPETGGEGPVPQINLKDFMQKNGQMCEPSWINTLAYPVTVGYLR